MKMIVLAVLAVVALAAAAPPETRPEASEPIPIVRSDFNQDPEGGYDFAFESGNGITRTENGEVKEVLDEENKPHKVVVVRGSYSYPGKDGEPGETVNYTADEYGYKADGPSIPKLEVPARR